MDLMNLLSKPQYLGLYVNIGGKLKEIRDPAYKRQEIYFGKENEAHGLKLLKNRNTISFGPLNRSGSIDAMIISETQKGETKRLSVNQLPESKKYEKGTTIAIKENELSLII